MTEVSDINIFRRICRNGVCVPTHVGSMEVSAKILSKTWPHQSNWDLQVELTALNATGEGLEGAYFDGVMGCEGSCITTRSNFPSQLLHVGNKISGYGTVRSTVGGAGVQATGHATMAMTVRGAASDLPGFHTVRVGPAARCDTIASTTVGCVFPDAGLVYGLPSWEYPDVARHVRLAQDSGLVGRNVPLHRLINEGREQNNRYIACNPSIPRPGGLDCDEYPFASTHEGAAMFGPGFGRTFPDCGRSDLSTVRTGPNGWSACLVPYFDNRGQGADLGRFYFLNRVLDGDDFYVEVD